MNKKTIIIALLAIVAMAGQGQTTYDTGEGCLNVVDFTYGKGIGEYGDNCVSANYLHEVFINEQFCIGGGIGYRIQPSRGLQVFRYSHLSQHTLFLS